MVNSVWNALGRVVASVQWRHVRDCQPQRPRPGQSGLFDPLGQRHRKFLKREACSLDTLGGELHTRRLGRPGPENQRVTEARTARGLNGLVEVLWTDMQLAEPNAYKMSGVNGDLGVIRPHVQDQDAVFQARQVVRE